VAGTTHKTIIGDIRFTAARTRATPGTVSQWQNGEFEVVWPEKLATAKLNPPNRPGNRQALAKRRLEGRALRP
jgi:branched-chain amino acid transport system substrate-binding protein